MKSILKKNVKKVFALAALILTPYCVMAQPNTALTQNTITSQTGAMVTAGEEAGIREEGTTAEIKIEETVRGSLAKSSKAEDRVITLELLNPNYEFNNDKLVIVPSKGFANTTGISSSYGVSNNKSDKSMLSIQMPKTKVSSLKGCITISGITVKALSKEFKPGKIDILVSGPNIQKTIVTVAEIKDYGISVINKSDKNNEIIVGSKGKISFLIQENVPDSMIAKQNIEVKLDKGYFAPEKNAGISAVKIGSIKLNGQDITKLVSLLPLTKEEFLTGFSFEVPGNIVSKKINKLEFNDVQVFAPAQSEGDLNVGVKIKDAKAETIIKAATIKAAVSVKAEPFKIKVGVKDQTGGKIVITETDKAMIKKGVIELEIENEPGITFPEKPTVTVKSGNIKVMDVRYNEDKPNVLEIYIERSSTKASVIEIANLVVTADFTVPDGGYKLILKGSALTPDTSLGAIEYDDFLIAGMADVSGK